MESKCKKCSAYGNFNSCTCYFGEDEETCKYKNSTNIQKNKIISEYEEEKEEFYKSYE